MSSSSTSSQFRTATEHYHGINVSTYNQIRMKQRRWQAEQRCMESFLATATADRDAVRILDMPVGTGRFIPLYQKYACAVTGADISTDMLAEAQKLVTPADKISFVETNAQSLADTVDPHEVTISFRFFNFMSLAEVKHIAAQMAAVTTETLVLTVWTVPTKPKNSIAHAKQLVKNTLYSIWRMLGRLYERFRNLVHRIFVTRDIVSRIINGVPKDQSPMKTVWHEKDAFIAAFEQSGFMLHTATVLETRFDGSTYYALVFSRAK